MLIDVLLTNDRVRMRDSSVVERKINKIINADKDKLLVVSDFDYTLSRFHDAEGRSCLTTHGVFDNAAWTISQELGIVLEKLKAKYLPIEFDPNITVAEKIPHMEDWWRTSHEHIIKTGFTKKMIQKFVYEAKLELKEGAEELMLTLRDHNVPLIIFSAGIGNVINFFLQKTLGGFPNNIHIVSNMMKYDENDVAVAFSEPLIHTFCKNSAVINHYGSLFSKISSRTCVLLMGDSLGELEDENRNCIQRDRDALYTLMRLENWLQKTQVFINYGNDYYRTRLTHSLKVAQIARSIARRLGLDEDITECIALAHDHSKMDVGLEYEQVALKIGFLNYNDETLLAQYLNEYDIVLLDDQTMHVPHLILNSIFGIDRDEKNRSTRLTCRLESKSKSPVITNGKSVALDNKVPN